MPCSTAGRWRVYRMQLLQFRKEIVRLIAEISMGAGTLAMIGGTVVIVGFLTLATGGVLAMQGYSSLGNIGIEALTGFLAAFINVRIAAPVVAGHRIGGHLRGGGDRAAGRDADQRGDRRAGINGDPPDRIPGVDADRGRDDRDHPAVLDRGDSVVRGIAVHHGDVVRAVRRPLRPLLQHLPQPDRSVVVVPAGDADGD